MARRPLTVSRIPFILSRETLHLADELFDSGQILVPAEACQEGLPEEKKKLLHRVPLGVLLAQAANKIDQVNGQGWVQGHELVCPALISPEHLDEEIEDGQMNSKLAVDLFKILLSLLRRQGGIEMLMLSLLMLIRAVRVWNGAVGGKRLALNEHTLQLQSFCKARVAQICHRPT